MKTVISTKKTSCSRAEKCSMEILVLIFVFWTIQLSLAQANLSTETQALLDFKASYAADSKLLQSWIVGRDRCRAWKGLTCWSTGLVRWVSLQNANLTGNFPAVLGSLSALTRLDLHHNQISGELAADVDFLVHMKRLNLSKNKLLGSIPEFIGKMQMLEELSLADNLFGGKIPDELFANLRRLEVLDVSNNELSGVMPESPSTQGPLRIVLLGGNNLSGPVPSFLGTITSLVKADLSGNRFTGILPRQWKSLNLSYLNLSNNQLQGQVPLELLNLSSLTNLRLGGNNFTGTISAQVSCRFGSSAFTGNPNLILEPCADTSNATILPLTPGSEPATKPPRSQLASSPIDGSVAPVPLAAVVQKSRKCTNFVLVLALVGGSISLISAAGGIITIFCLLCRARNKVKLAQGDAFYSKGSDSLYYTSRATESTGPPSHFKVSTTSDSLSRQSSDMAKSISFASIEF